jgi:Protein of unknown function (DUF2637)
MTGMSPVHARLTYGQRRALLLAVTLVAAGMAIGFLSSFTTLYAAAAVHGWRYPALLPLAVDSGILAYVILDHLAVILGDRSRWLHLAAWLLAAFTVWANAAVSAAGGDAWRVIHAAMPALWVLGVEALRFFWRRLHADPSQPDRIPAGRWAAAPWPTLLLWRRMRLLGITAWPLMLATEDARLHLRDLVAAVRERYPDRSVPLVVRRAVRTGRFPGEVTERIKTSLDYGGATVWEPAMETWLSDRLRLPAGISEAISADRMSTPPDPAPAAHETQSPAPHEAPPVTPPRARARKPAKPSPRRMSDDDLMTYVRDLFARDPAPSLGAVRRATGTGPERARKLLERGSDEHRQNRMVRVK